MIHEFTVLISIDSVLFNPHSQISLVRGGNLVYIWNTLFFTLVKDTVCTASGSRKDTKPESPFNRTVGPSIRAFGRITHGDPAEKTIRAVHYYITTENHCFQMKDTMYTVVRFSNVYLSRVCKYICM